MSFRASNPPILLSAPYVNIAAGASGDIDVAQLSSPFRRPMWVDEIRFSYGGPSGTSGLQGLADSIRCKLTMGRIAITHTRDGGGFVPIWNFGPSLQSYDLVEQSRDLAFGSVSVVWGHFRWLLPRPLYLPAGMQVIPTFFRTADGISGNARVSVAIVGRDIGDAAEPVPEKINVPYVGLYEPDINATFGMSSELDLVNPFLVPLHVQRFIGRLLSVDLSSGVPALRSRNEANADLLAAGTDDFANVAIQDSWGSNIVRDFAPFYDVFDGNRRAWTFVRTLLPKERYLIRLLNIAVLTPSVTYARPTVSMIGWREEAFR